MSTLYFSFQFIVSLFRTIVSPKVKYNLNNGIIICYSLRAFEATTNFPKRFSSKPVLIFPWVGVPEKVGNQLKISVFSLTSLSDLISAFKFAILATKILKKRRGFSFWILQTYTAFRWFLVRIVVDKFKGEIVIGEHYDRWAVLTDRSIREQQRSLGRKSINLSLLQHGLVEPIYSNESFVSKDLPAKLSRVTSLFVYNETQLEIFLNFFLSGQASNKLFLDVNFFEPTIQISPITKKRKLSILFVGHSMCENYQQELFEKLTKVTDFDCFYKPHPQARPLSQSIKENDWFFIKDPLFFPAVDMLISYESTLVLEYKIHNVPAVIHKLNPDERLIENDLTACLEMLNSIHG